MSNSDDYDKQHRNWMDVTGTAMHPVHSASGYKGESRRALIRPHFPESTQDAKPKKKG